MEIKKGNHIAVVLGYLLLSLAFFGLPLLPEPSRAYIGTGTDPSLFIWHLAWWPYAFLNGLDPFLTSLVWAPIGFNLAWATSIPGLSLAAFPITLSLGPVVAYNILSLLGPALSAWTAYLLCRYLTGAFWPSVVGGYLFGFSTYQLGHMLAGHLAFTCVFIPPVLVHLVLLRLDNKIKASTFILLMGAALVCQFLIATEVFATVTVFGGITWLVALRVFPRDVGRRLLRTGSLILCSSTLAAVVLSPSLYYTFAFGFPRSPINSPTFYSTDPLNWLIPTSVTLLGSKIFTALSAHFTGNLEEQSAYLGLPLLFIVWSFFRRSWPKPVSKLLLILLSVICIASLGPELHLTSIRIHYLPWKLAGYLPLINHALPARFMLYAFLIVAVIVSLWLSSAQNRRGTKWTVAVLSILFLLPNLSGHSWTSQADTPLFFATSLHQQYLEPNENILILPYGSAGNSMLWHAQSGMSFRMAGGYVGLTPPEFARWPILHTLFTGHLILDYQSQLKAFLAAHRITTVIVKEDSQRPWLVLLSTLETDPVRTGGVLVYRVPAHLLPATEPTADEITRRVYSAQFSAMVTAANEYVSTGFKLEHLTLLKTQELQLLPHFLRADTSPGIRYPAVGSNKWLRKQPGIREGLWLGPWESEMLAVGIVGTYSALEPLISPYRRIPSTIYFPYPLKLSAETPSKEQEGLLLMIFTRDGIRRAATIPWL